MSAANVFRPGGFHGAYDTRFTKKFQSATAAADPNVDVDAAYLDGVIVTGHAYLETNGFVAHASLNDISIVAHASLNDIEVK